MMHPQSYKQEEMCREIERSVRKCNDVALFVAAYAARRSRSYSQADAILRTASAFLNEFYRGDGTKTQEGNEVGYAEHRG